MASFQSDTGRMKLKSRPTIKVGSQFTADTDIFSQAPPEQPTRMRKAVEVVEVPEDTGAVKVGRKHIEAPTAREDTKDGFGGTNYAPTQSDRFRGSQRYQTSGNVITGEGVDLDAFSQKRQRGTGVSVRREQFDHIRHAPEEAPHVAPRPQHENLKKQQRSYCPFAVDDGYQPPEQPIRPLHEGNINHGDVLTGGAMQVQYAGRNPTARHF